MSGYQLTIEGLLWSSLIGSAMFSGASWGFSGFIMPGLARIDGAEAMRAMNAINLAFVKTLMLPLFILSGVTHLALAVMTLLNPAEPGAMWMLAGGATYVVGMLLITVIFEVPLNNALIRLDPASAEGTARWTHYLRVWTNWNTVRTLAAFFAFVLLAVAIALR